ETTFDYCRARQADEGTNNRPRVTCLTPNCDIGFKMLTCGRRVAQAQCDPPKHIARNRQIKWEHASPDAQRAHYAQARFGKCARNVELTLQIHGVRRRGETHGLVS